MTTRTHHAPPEIDFSTFPETDGLPMAETEVNLVQMIDLILQGKQALEPRGHHVGGNLLVYYDRNDGWKHLSPDVFVALDVDAAPRESWKTWIEGKFPEVVFEVASPSTRDRDIGAKVRLYTQLGAREYYIFDPARALQPPFRGYSIGQGSAEPLPNPTGHSIVSPLLGLELRVVDGWLRLIDPRTNAPYLLPAEEREARQRAEREALEAKEAAHAAQAAAHAAEAAQAAAHAAEAAAQATARAAQAAVQAAEARADAEAAARAESDAELARLRAEIARLRGQPPSP
jgi:Uma2 family endonuclease